MKELLTTIYTDFETLLDEEFTENVDQEDVFSASPLAGCLKLKFRRVTKVDCFVPVPTMNLEELRSQQIP